MPYRNKERMHDQAIEVIGHFADTTAPELETWRTDYADQITFARTVARNAESQKPLKVYDLKNYSTYDAIATDAVDILYPVERDGTPK